MPIPAVGDIGKASKELLTGGRGGGTFVLDPKLTFASTTSSGVTFTVTAVKKGEKIEPSLKTAYSTKKYSADATIEATDKISVNTSFSDVAPGVKVTGSVVLPDPASAKAGVEYVNPYLNLKGTVSLTSTPIVDVAASTGYNKFVLGTEATYSSAKAAVTKLGAAVGYHAADYQVAAAIADWGSTVKLSYSHNVTNQQVVGAEIVRKLTAGTTAFSLGYSRKLASGAAAKIKIDNSGLLSLLYETKLSTGEKVAGALQLQATDLSKPLKYGFSVDFL